MFLYISINWTSNVGLYGSETSLWCTEITSLIGKVTTDGSLQLFLLISWLYNSAKAIHSETVLQILLSSWGNRMQHNTLTLALAIGSDSQCSPQSHNHSTVYLLCCHQLCGCCIWFSYSIRSTKHPSVCVHEIINTWL